MQIIKQKLSYKLMFLFILMLVGCKTILAPEYDKVIVESVTATSEQTMIFLASVDQGTSIDTFSEREVGYNELIGAFDALKIQAKARPIPNNDVAKKVNKLLQSKGTEAVSGVYPSAIAFEKISETLQKMKSTDMANGLKPGAVQAFKGQIEIFLDQAITYESFLKR